MYQITQDFKFSLRLLSKSPSFTCISTLVVVIGLALYLCAYSLRYNFSDKPLPFDGGDRYIGIKTIFEKTGVGYFGANFDAYAINYFSERVNSYEQFGAYRYQSLTLSDGEYPQEFTGAEIMPHLLEMTGVQPLMGRLLSENDAEPGAEPVALIRYKVWQNYFAGDPDIIGSTTRIDGLTYTIVGVMPKGFDYPNSQHIWLPLHIKSSLTPASNSLSALGKLKAGITHKQATQEINRLLAELVEEYPAFYAHSPSAEVLPLLSAINPSSGSGIGDLVRLLNIVILLLVILNLAALLFVRAHTREKELAVRSAVGANGFQVAKQILLESLLICVVGLLFSLLIADAILYLTEQSLIQDATESDFPGDLSSWVNLSIDWRALGVAVSVTLLIWLLSGAWVAYRAARIDNNSILAAGGKGANQQANHWLVRAVISVEVVVSCFLLIVCCLLAVSIFKLYQLDYGTATDNYFTAFFNLEGSQYDSPEQRQRFLENVQYELSALPEFEAATLTTALPGQFGIAIGYDVEDFDLRTNRQYPTQFLVAVAPNYFNLLEVKLREGRWFKANDNRASLPVAIIDEILAQQLWPDQSPLGKRLLVSSSASSRQWVTIVGTTQHIIQGNPFGGLDKHPTLYRPLQQFTPTRFSVAVKLRSQVSDFTAEQQLKTTFKKLDRDLALMSPRPLERVIEMSLGGMHLTAKSAIGYALATLIFAVIGIYGLIARSVLLRTNEIGIRKALGSTPIKVIWLFLRQGLVYLLLGTLIGGAGAVLASNSLTTYFTNIFSSLPLVVAAVTVVIGVLVLLASYLPTRKALALEPGDALRYE